MPDPTLPPSVLAEGRRLLAAATEGPWFEQLPDGRYGLARGRGLLAQDMEFLVWLRNYADALLDAAEGREGDALGMSDEQLAALTADVVLALDWAGLQTRLSHVEPTGMGHVEITTAQAMVAEVVRELEIMGRLH